jgi:D-alanyl-D-alanine dipeptidase
MVAVLQKNNEKESSEVYSAAELPPDYDTTAWTELVRLAPGVLLDLRYATKNNFVETVLYDCGRCFFRPSAAKAIAAVQMELRKSGLGLKVFDCYRPRSVQYSLWKKVPDPKYVADPKKGSAHNRGIAIDLTLVDSSGKELNMGTEYDYFGREAHHTFQNLPADVLKNRKLLLNVMAKYGFYHTNTEWWHYSMRIKGVPLDDWKWECP